MTANTIPMESFPDSAQLEIDRKQQLADYSQKWADLGVALVNLCDSGVQPWVRGQSDAGFRGYPFGSNVELALRIDAQGVTRSVASGYGRFTRTPRHSAATMRNDDLSIIAGMSRAVVRLDNYKVRPEEAFTVGINGEATQFGQGTAFSDACTSCELPSPEDAEIRAWTPGAVLKHSKVLDGLVVILASNSIDWRS